MTRLRAVALFTALLAGACAPPRVVPTGEISTFPAPERLPELDGLPELRRGHDGTRVETAEDLATWRAKELRALFSHYLYGVAPPAVPVTVQERGPITILDGAGVYRELEVVLDGDGPRLHVALFLPAGVERPPVLVGLNKCGAQTLLEDPAIRQTTGFVAAACEGGARGSQLAQWSIASVLAQGVAVATFHDSDAAPDDASQPSPVSARFVPTAPTAASWGAIAVWSWSVSRVVDALVVSPWVDGSRIGAFGHSRRGKTALWAAANDARISLVVAHQSGLAGAAPSRSAQGETMQFINALFPHWFCGNYKRFIGREARLPVDQHELLALLAPRAVLITDGDDDAWANPPGALADVRAADEAWQLFGDEGLVEDEGAARPRTDTTLVWRSRPGGHETTTADWATFLSFVKRHWP